METNQTVHDNNGHPIAYLKQRWSFGSRCIWEAFRGQKALGPEDMLFAAERPSAFQWESSFGICLKGKETPDFTLSPGHWGTTIKILYRGVLIAKAELKSNFGSPVNSS